MGNFDENSYYMGRDSRRYGGVAGAGLGLGTAGTALGVLNMLGNGANWLGGWGRNGNCGNGYGYYNNNAQQDIIAQQASEIAFYRAKSYSDETGLAQYKYVDGRLRELEERIHQNEVAQVAFNSTTTASLNTLSAQLNDARVTLAGITRTAVPQSAICDFGCGCNSGCSRQTV